MKSSVKIILVDWNRFSSSSLREITLLQAWKSIEFQLFFCNSKKCAFHHTNTITKCTI